MAPWCQSRSCQKPTRLALKSPKNIQCIAMHNQVYFSLRLFQDNWRLHALMADQNRKKCQNQQKFTTTELSHERWISAPYSKSIRRNDLDIKQLNPYLVNNHVEYQYSFSIFPYIRSTSTLVQCPRLNISRSPIDLTAKRYPPVRPSPHCNVALCILARCNL